MTDTTVLRARPAGGGPGRGPDEPGRDSLGLIRLAPILALVAVGIGLLLGAQGVDLSASVHRVDEFRRYGLAVWDGSWYGGQWTLPYSVLFAPVAATLGLPLTALAASAGATFAFVDLLRTRVRGSVGDPALVAAALVFAVGNVVATSIGQLPFLTGEACALAALAAAGRRRWLPAWGAALGASLFSPLAGFFLGIAVLAWTIVDLRDQRLRPPADWRRTRRWWRAPRASGRRACSPESEPHPRRRWTGPAALLGLGVAAGVPVVTTAGLFPGQGVMPFEHSVVLWDLLIAGLAGLAGWRLRTVRVGIALYVVALVGCAAVNSSIGVNVGRLGDVMALPLAVLGLWDRRRVLLGLVAIPLFLSEWGPATGALGGGRTDPSAHAAFYRPLDAWLARHDPDGRDGRVEVVPTKYHWESVYTANVVPLARGWERQTDMSDDPLFYRSGALDPADYVAWLRNEGVRYVALPDAPLDPAGTEEGALVASNPPGLDPVWTSADWRVYRVDGSSGLVAGPARVLAVGNSSLRLDLTGTAPVLVRVRSNADWRLPAGEGCLTAAPGDWVELHPARLGPTSLRLALSGLSAACPAATPAAAPAH